MITHVPRGKQVLPMKAALTLKPIPGVKTKKKKARVCICGNFQKPKEGESYYTANIDITSIRMVLSIAAQQSYGVSNLDINTAFLNASLSTAEEELIYVKPPALLVAFDLVPSNVYWICRKAIYGLRQSPRDWGKHRDKGLKQMRLKVGNKELQFMQSTIDVALWILVEDKEEHFDHKKQTYGYMLTYVDDFLMVGPDDVRKAIEEGISKIWKFELGNTVRQFDKANLGASLTFLSIAIRSHPKFGGFTMSQELFIKGHNKILEHGELQTSSHTG